MHHVYLLNENENLLLSFLISSTFFPAVYKRMMRKGVISRRVKVMRSNVNDVSQVVSGLRLMNKTRGSLTTKTIEHKTTSHNICRGVRIMMEE
jgi:hypothetical protein